MIKSANQHPVFALLSPQGNAVYRVPPYQREYSWQKAQWEALFDDLIEAEGPHFLGTIICLDQSVDALEKTVYEVIDGQQRLTTLSLLLTAVYSIMNEHKSELDEDALTDLTNLRRQIVGKGDSEARLTPQRQGQNRDDFIYVLKTAGLPVDGKKPTYLGLRKIHRCFQHFRDEIRGWRTRIRPHTSRRPSVSCARSSRRSWSRSKSRATPMLSSSLSRSTTAACR